MKNMKAYTTEIVEKIQSDCDKGLSGLTEISYRNMFGYRKPDMVFAHTHEEMIEYCKCKIDPVYFIEKYCTILTYNGKVHFNLRPYQIDIIKDYFNHRFNVNTVSRQTGITTVLSLLMLHEAIFNTEKAIVLASYNRERGTEKLDKVKAIYSELPYFLKPGVRSTSQREIRFDNGCSISVQTGNSMGRGFQIHRLFVDDFSHFPPSMQDAVYHAMFPILLALKDSKIFISSSPNGLNHYYTLVYNAERKEGDPLKSVFNANRVYWWEVPGRDENWKRMEINNMGSEELFNQEYDLQFFAAK